MKILKLIIRVSLLLAMVVLCITALFPGWYDNRGIIFNEVSQRFMSNDEVIMREKASRADVPYQEYKEKAEAKKKAKALLAKLNAGLDQAIAANDSAAINRAVAKFSAEQIKPNNVVSLIESSNITAFTALYQQSLACNTDYQRDLVKTQMKNKTATDYRVSQFETKVSRAVLANSNDALMLAWYEMKCWRSATELANKHDYLKALAHKLVVRNKPNRVLALKNAEDFDYLLTQVLWQSLNKRNDAAAQSLFEKAYVEDTKKKPIVSFVDVKKGRGGISSDLVFYALKNNHLLFAESVLQYDPEYIKRNNLSWNIYNDIVAKRFPERKTVQLLSNGLLDLESVKIDVNSELTTAIENGITESVLLLLNHDAKATLKNLPVTDWENFRRSSANLPLQTQRFLFERGLDYGVFAYQGVDQLANAMSKGDEALVEFYLAEAGVKPAIEYRGKTILDAAIGGDTKTQQRILALLTEYGAHDDYFKLIREITGVEYDPNCSVGQPLEPSRYASNKLVEQLKAAESQQPLTPMNFYEAAIVHCVSDNGHDLDSCIVSIRACSDSSAATPRAQMKSSDLCCPSHVKRTYTQARCSGMDVASAAVTLRGTGFTEAYTIPLFFTYTKEYKELQESQQKTSKESEIKNERATRNLHEF